MTILVLGGTQFVGRHIVETLHSAGHSVTIVNGDAPQTRFPLRSSGCGATARRPLIQRFAHY